VKQDAWHVVLRRPPLAAGVVGLVTLAIALVVWTAVEARSQRRQTEEALTRQALLAARSLGPALASTAAASRELDEIVAWKLLDNARLLAWMDDRGVLDDRTLRETLEANGLDLVAVYGSDGAIERSAGEPVPSDLPGVELADLLAGRADEAVFERALEDQPLHVSAAVARRAGGAILTRTHAETAYAFARRIGVSNLLEHLVGEAGVLYVAYIENDGRVIAWASWDGGPLPERHAHSGTEPIRGREAFEVVVPVPAPAGHEGGLHLGLDATPLKQASLAATWRTALIGLVLAAFGLLGAGYALVERERQREREAAALRLAAEEDRRRHSERLASAGALAAGVAHEVRNPLNAISVAAQRLERCEAIGDCCVGLATTIRNEVRRLDDIVRGFLDLARPTFGPRERVDVAEIAREVIDVLEPEAASREIGLGLELDGDAVAIVDREAMRRAIVNLVRNAMQASAPGLAVTVRLEGDRDALRVRVRDRGPGVDPALAGRAFDPFVTGRAAGTGLGLALVRRVAEDHGGWATLDDVDGGGAEAVLQIRREDTA